MINRLKSIWQEYSDKDNILVYQFGKVGSTALQTSIPNAIHTHALYGNFPCHIYSSQQRKGLNWFFGYFGDFIKRVAIRRRKEIKIIVIVREPISRNISMFFQDLAHWIYHYAESKNFDNRFSGDDYLENVFYESFDHNYINYWFDKELSRFVGFDVLGERLNPDVGYSRIKKGKFDILICQQENIGVWHKALKEFNDIDLELINNNVGDNKWYGDIYKKFKKSFVPSQSYIDKAYSSKYVEKIYSAEQIKKIRCKYEKK